MTKIMSKYQCLCYVASRMREGGGNKGHGGAGFAALPLAWVWVWVWVWASFQHVTTHIKLAAEAQHQEASAK